MSWAKVSSVPATASARAMVASLPDCTIMPRMRSATVTGFPGSMNMREPPAFHAFSETATVFDGSSLRSRIAANTM